MVVEDHQGLWTVECLRGRLLAERKASKAAQQDALLMENKLLELQEQLKLEIESKNKAEKKLNYLINKLHSLNLSPVTDSSSYDCSRTPSSSSESGDVRSTSSDSDDLRLTPKVQEYAENTTPTNLWPTAKGCDGEDGLLQVRHPIQRSVGKGDVIKSHSILLPAGV